MPSAEQPLSEPGLLKQATQGTPYPPKFHPYGLYQRHPLQFTIRDLDKCLYGKQELRVVQIGDRKATPPVVAPKTPNSASSSGMSNSEDKNKPAKWCDMCQEIRFGECPQHGSLPSLRPTLTLPGPKSYAISTFPDEVGLCISTLPLAGYGVFARHFISMGPYEGKKIPVEDGLKQISVGDAPFLWEIYENLRLSHFLDASDENASSWMRFIQCARHRGEQNLFVFQYYGSIYYRAFKDVPVGSELLVWYDDKYPQYFGMPYDIRDMSSFSMESIQAPTEIPKKSGEFDPNRPHHVESRAPHPFSNDHVDNRAPHPFSHGGKVIPSSKSAARNRNDIARIQPNCHGVHPRSAGHASGSFLPPPVQPPTLSQAPGIIDTRTVHSAARRTHASHPQLPHPPLPHGHSPRPGIDPVFGREPLLSTSSMLRSMSADDLRKRNTPNLQSITERELMERVAHSTELPTHPPPPGLLGPHMNLPPGALPHHYNTPAAFSKLPPSVMSVTSVGHEHSRMKLDELNKHNELKFYHERERAAFERERLVREQDRLVSRTSHERAMHDSSDRESWEIYRCQGCGQSFTQKLELDKHRCISEASKPYQCGRCQLSFQELRDLQEHMVMHTSERPFKCGVCSRSFSGTNTLSAHMRSHAINDPNLPTKENMKAPPPTLDCQHCGKRFQQLTDLHKHLATPGECGS